MIKRTVFISLLLFPALAFAQQPSTQRGRPQRPLPPMRKPATRPADDPQEFEKALAFLDKLSPNRFKAYQSLDEERRGIFRDRIMAFYRGNQIITKDEELWKLREQVIKAEDNVFGIRWEILANGGLRRATDEDKGRLRSAVAEMVKVQMKERTLRLDRWKKWVSGEEDQLAGINANIEGYVDQRLRDELEGKGLGLFDHPRRPGGPGAPNPPGTGGGGGPGGQKGPDGKSAEKQPAK
jgi:hypothetical protein